ncbi:gluconate 2-dehydrogenase subunit 3 family protein [Cryptosporangium phraense]|uniref:Gluconate 2-dehydrogenase subunit 3 family protein n=1 Tax=Cryptosporangium phraense TaxID=2593070 RepID=A0A545AH79_9ACTN|nr:gluconate 2-dehydrogenase subunit 3 family protein [Cryptosporangium phraense]TQS40620.1 gluconate 2-dehydrogenase subunit 3 family protein [Cryptosporangium phraense]
MTSYPAIRVRSGAGAPPRRPDGERYRFELIDGGGRWRVYADERTDLVAELIPGYADLDEPARSDARRDGLVGAQILAQARLAADTSRCTPAQREVLLGSRETPPVLDEDWTAPVPLVLITGFYAPLGALPRPGGDVIWLDSETEESYLRALRLTGMVVLAERV